MQRNVKTPWLTVRIAAVFCTALASSVLADWTYYPAGHIGNPHPSDPANKAVISNGVWVLNAAVRTDKSADWLTLGESGTGHGNAFTGIGAGDLDLRGEIRDADFATNGKTYFIRE